MAIQGKRQQDGEGRPHTGRALHANPPPVGVHYLAHIGEADACAVNARLRDVAAALKTIEDSGVVLTGNSDTVVSHGKHRPAAICAGLFSNGYEHFATPRTVLDGVSNQ